MHTRNFKVSTVPGNSIVFCSGRIPRKKTIRAFGGSTEQGKNLFVLSAKVPSKKIIRTFCGRLRNVTSLPFEPSRCRSNNRETVFYQ